jgi:hypothetical protein
VCKALIPEAETLFPPVFKFMSMVFAKLIDDRLPLRRYATEDQAANS